MNFLKSLYRFFSPRYQTLFLEYNTEFKPRFEKSKSHALLYDIINSRKAEYEELLQHFLIFTEELVQIKTGENETRVNEPRWNNGFLPGLDIVALYSLIAIYKPKLYVEIGSGNSTMVARKSIKNHGLPTKIISIDPAPRTAIDQLADTIIRKPLEDLNNFDFVDNLERMIYYLLIIHIDVFLIQMLLYFF
ncbi:MAG: hypothetical protein ABIQ74_14290 [Chitinophagales bacterium]